MKESIYYVNKEVADYIKNHDNIKNKIVDSFEVLESDKKYIKDSKFFRNTGLFVLGLAGISSASIALGADPESVFNSIVVPAAAISGGLQAALGFAWNAAAKSSFNNHTQALNEQLRNAFHKTYLGQKFSTDKESSKVNLYKIIDSTKDESTFNNDSPEM